MTDPHDPEVTTTVTFTVRGRSKNLEDAIRDLVQAAEVLGNRYGCTLRRSNLAPDDRDILAQDITALNLESRLEKKLRFWHNIHTVGDLVARRRNDLYKPNKIGWPSINLIEKTLANRFELKLRQE